MSRVAVIGGGLSGLTAAHVLVKAQHDVVVLEAEARFGGQLHTVIDDGFVVELGAEGFVARSQAVPALAKEVGLESELMGQALTRSLGYRGGELRELAPGEAAAFLGFQVPQGDLGQGIRTLRRGMGSLSDALVAHLTASVELETGTNVTTIERRDHGYRIRRAEGRPFDAQRIVVATSSKGAARLLGPIIGPAATQLLAADTLSSVTVSLAYERSAIAHPLDATGVVLASDDQLHGIRAIAFTSDKFEHRAPAGKALLRVFFRPSEHDLKLETDATFAARAAERVAAILPVSEPPLRSWVSRWPHALPVFGAVHHERVLALSQALEGSGIALAGSAYFGAGIDAAVRSAQEVLQRL
jgi:protoporphyrinogen/coproporphyrinogen III oxidase